MDGSLHQLVQDVMIVGGSAGDTTGFTHLTFFGPRQRLSIKTSECSNFWTRYCEIVADDQNKDRVDRKFSLAEIPEKLVPVLANCTLRFPSADSPYNDPYGEDFIMGVVNCYQQAIQDCLIISQEQTELACCVLEPEVDYIDDGELIVQFKLQFPYCRTEEGVQKRLIRPKVLQNLRHMNLFARLPEQPSNDWEMIIDPMVPSDPWPLYRSTSDAAHPKLSLTHIYWKIEPEHIESGEGPEIELEKIFNPTYHEHAQQRLITPDMFEEHDIFHWLPMFLSINYWQRATLPRHDVDTTVLKITTPMKTSSSPYGLRDQVEETDIDIAEHLLHMLSRERVETEHFWIDIGKALWNACEGNERGLNVWIRFTESSDDYSEADCKIRYSEFRQENTITVKTIAWYARQDNPDQYNQWHRDWCVPYLERATSLSHTDIAQALYHVYWLEFACSLLKEKRWYQFENHRWNPLDSGITLRRRISGDFLKRFESFRTELARQIHESDEDNFKMSAEIMMKKLTDLIRKLKTVHFKNALMTEAMEIFYNSKFKVYSDSNPNLMGLINGIVETTETYATVRDGKPEDYVTMCAGVYYQDYDWNHPEVKTFLYWMRQCFTDPDLCTYFLRLISSCLRSGNQDKLFPIMTGDGNNSKSMVKKLVEAVFGAYSHTFPTTFFTQRRAASSNATPELAQAIFAKIAWAQEPDEDDTIRNGTIKEMTGLDQTFARLLHDNGGNFTVLFKLFLMCNKIPTIPGADDAVKQRVTIVPFLSKWVDPTDPKTKNIKLPDDEAEQFKSGLFLLDRSFSDKISRMAPASLWVFVQMYEDYKKNGLQVPKSVTVATDKYWEENDVYHLFTNECIRPAIRPNSITDETPHGERDPSAKMTLTDIYAEFKFWFRDAYPGLKLPEKNSVKYELEQRWGKLHLNAWHGICPVETLANI